MTPTILHGLRLGFFTDTNSIMNITLPRANPTRTEAQVIAAMQTIIDTGIVRTARGIPVALESAERLVTTRTDIAVLA